MKSFSLQTSLQDMDGALAAYGAVEPQVLIVFSSRENIRDGAIPSRIMAAFPGARVVGCSTAGEMGDSVRSDSVAIIGMHMDKGRIKCASVKVQGPDSMEQVGAALAAELAEDELVGVFILSPGVNVNGSRLTRALKDRLPSGVSISGGLAGDALAFTETLTVLDGDVAPDKVVALGLYGKDVVIRNGSHGGWKPFGPLRRVTKAQQNVLYELDGKPALDLYKQYLGDKAADLPSSGLLYPFAIMQDDGNSVGLIRTILNIDEKANSLILAGDMEVGQLVCLMHGNTDDLVSAAERAAERSVDGHGDVADCAAICVSCVGRRILMGEDTEEELDAVRSVLGTVPLAGFYSYGEIAESQDTQQAELHNQTMTVTCISERA